MFACTAHMHQPGTGNFQCKHESVFVNYIKRLGSAVDSLFSPVEQTVIPVNWKVGKRRWSRTTIMYRNSTSGSCITVMHMRC